MMKGLWRDESMTSQSIRHNMTRECENIDSSIYSMPIESVFEEIHVVTPALFFPKEL